MLVALLGVSAQPAGATIGDRVDLRVLLFVNGTPSPDAMATQMTQEGVPFTTVDLSSTSRPIITDTFLADAATHAGHFQAIVLPGPPDTLPMTPVELAALAGYESAYGVRQVDAYAYPGASVGLNTPDFAGTLDASTATVTADGRSGPFGYLTGSLPIDDLDPAVPEVYGYLATPAPLAAGQSFTPLVTGSVGATTGSLLGVYAHDGREELVVTAAYNGAQQWFKALGHGIITWMTRGVHLGHHRNYFTFHFDDAFAADSRWDPVNKCTPTEDCPATVTATTADIRMTPADVAAVVSWVTANNYTPTLAFNGYYSLNDGDGRPWNGTDLLTNALVANKASFRWLNHGYQHIYQGCAQDFTLVPWRCVTNPAGQAPAADGSNLVWATQDAINTEIAANIAQGIALGLPFDTTEYLSGEHSGLYLTPQQPVDNPNYAAALTQNGIKVIGADASREPAARQVGSALTIPRHPTALYYNTSTMEEAVSEYNWLYLTPPAGKCVATAVTTCMSSPVDLSTGFDGYILPRDTAFDMGFILSNDPRPFYAHVSNLTGPDYLGLKLMTKILTTYRGSFADSAPLLNLTETQAADALSKQTAWSANQSQVTAYWDRTGVHVSGTGKVPLTVPAGTTLLNGIVMDSYDGEMSAWIDAPAVDTLVAVPVVAGLPGAPTIGTATAGDASATVTWTAPASIGGSPITSYSVNTYVGNATTPVQTLTAPAGATSLTVTGLTNGTAYTFAVAATNSAGTGAYSPRSAAVTPAAVVTPPVVTPPVVTPPATVPSAPVGLPAVTVVLDRLAGEDRVRTAIAVSQAGFPTGTAGGVVLASGRDFPDALVGATLAARRNAPLLLTAGTVLPRVTVTEIQRVLPAGGTVDILGGTGAVPASVLTQLTGLGYHVDRHGGADRYATAIAVADALGDPGTVLLASGTDFPDALTAGPAAATQHGVVLLTSGSTLPGATKAYLAAHPGTVTAVGGLAAAADPGARGLVGADRYATAVAVASTFFPAPTTVGIASGLMFPDAVVGAAQLARIGAPLLLSSTGSLPTPTGTYLAGLKGSVTTVHLFGGTAVISDSVATRVATILGR